VFTYDVALQMTLMQSPQLNSSLAEIEEREGERVQSGLYLNPLFSSSVENVLGNKHWKGWGSAEYRYEISQAVPLGCQRTHLSNIAEYRFLAAQYEHCSLELRMANDLKKTFLDVAASQELLKIAVEQKRISENIMQAVQAKVESGKISPLEKSRAALGIANSRLALEKAEMDLDVARQKLSLFWGSCSPDFDCVHCSFFEVECPSAYEERLVENEYHPLVLKAQMEEQIAWEEVELEKAVRIPNVILTAGFKSLQDCGDKSVILGVAFPLPIFDRNQGNICRAQAKTFRICHQSLDLELQLESKLSILHKEAMRAYNELLQLKTCILELAEESFAYAKSGYDAGKYEYLDLMDAQKNLFEAQERYVHALLLFFQKQVDIEFLTL